MISKLFSTRILAFASFLLAATFWAYHKVNPLLFNPVNGDFQTFNPISRLLDGQFPYHDFANYLGVGPLLTTTLAALPFRASFAGSVASTEILVSIVFLYMATMAFRLLGTSRPWLFAIVLYFIGRLPFFMELLPPSQVAGSISMLFKTTTNYLGLKFLVAPGHSVMPLRVLWPFLAVLPLILYLRAPSVGRSILLGAVLGAGVIWSNDFGPATALAFGLIAMLASRNVKHIVIAIATALVALASAVFLATGGHPADWITFNRAVIQDQFWYYYFPERKVISLDTLELNETTWVLLLVAMSGFVFLRWARNNPTPEMLGLMAIFTATMLAAILSLFGSSWFNYYMSAPVFLCLAAMIHHYAPAIRKRLNPDGIPVRASFGAIIATLMLGFFLHPSTSPANVHEAKLGAPLHKNYDGFDDMMEKVRAADNDVWSTYSTAVEAALGIHQPSGQDYIIHALGDTGRAKYLETFNARKPRLVITPRPDKILWEVWARIVNWWFYRELLRDYAPVGHGPYWTLWERIPNQAQPTRELACTVHQVAPGSVRVEVNGGIDAAERVADVTLTYHAESPAFTRLLLEVEDEGLKRQYLEAVKRSGIDASIMKPQTSVGFPPNAGQWRVPVQLDRDGAGISTIHANLRSKMGATLNVSDCTALDWAPPGRIDR